MSQASTTSIADPAAPAMGPPVEPSGPPPVRSFVAHARLMAGITLVSRLLGMARESIVANYFGAGPVWSAFTTAFTVPNLFRKLLGEGALSAAFIPLYVQAVKRDRHRAAIGADTTHEGHVDHRDFAAASVNLLCVMLLGLTVIGEVVLLLIDLLPLREDWRLAVKLTAIMLPYVMMVCGAALLCGILQVHERFGITVATSIVLNACLIVGILAAARLYDLKTTSGQEAGVEALSWLVLAAGVIQIAILLPSLRAVGFRFRLGLSLWTPALRRMLRLTGPVALGAGVLQVSTMLDRMISFVLAEGPSGQTHFVLLGHAIRYPMAAGATARLNWAQYLYQFPLGVFAIALATAIFPKLSSDAVMDTGSAHSSDARVSAEFAAVLRQGIQSSLFIGLPASIGMVLVATPAVRLLFQRGNFTPADTALTALSTAIYSSAIWAFSLQQIINRAYYALHDMMTPLIWAVANLLINTAVELPLLWSPLHESGMAAGTLVSFAIQSLAMLWLLERRCGGLNLALLVRPLGAMLAGCVAMTAACVAVRHLPHYPAGGRSTGAAAQLAITICVGGGVYFVTCAMLGLDVTKELRRRRAAPSGPSCGPISRG
jgi:putative peptidoglycan lipid II flippase